MAGEGIAALFIKLLGGRRDDDGDIQLAYARKPYDQTGTLTYVDQVVINAVGATDLIDISGAGTLEWILITDNTVTPATLQIRVDGVTQVNGALITTEITPFPIQYTTDLRVRIVNGSGNAGVGWAVYRAL